MAHAKNTKCEAHEQSKAWGDAKPCGKPQRGKCLCNGHLAQLARRGGDVAKLTPLLGKHGQRLKDEVQLGSVRVEREVARRIAKVGAALGAKPRSAKYRGTQALVEAFHRGDLVWAPGKDPEARTGS